MGCRCRGGQNIPVHAFLTSWIYGPDKCHRSRHLPKTIRSTDNLKHTMLEARRVKEERRRKHTRAGDSKPKPGKSWWNKHRLLNVFYMFSCRLYRKKPDCNFLHFPWIWHSAQVSTSSLRGEYATDVMHLNYHISCLTYGRMVQGRLLLIMPVSCQYTFDYITSIRIDGWHLGKTSISYNHVHTAEIVVRGWLIT